MRGSIASRRRLLAFAGVFAGLAATAAGPAAAVSRQDVYAARSASSTSSNWSGYVVSGNAGLAFSDITGTWVEPTVTCTSSTTASAFWIGLGGSSTGSPGLEQIGTSADCQYGRPTYYAWFEILPAASVTLPLTIAPGDTITADVSATDTTFTFTLTDVTTGSTYSKAATVAQPAVDSAEWIAEAPSTCTRTCQVLPLANFGTASFSAASATGNGHAGPISDPAWTNDAIQLGTRSILQALPSPLSDDGASFSVAWKATGAVVTPPPKRTRRGTKPKPHLRGGR